MFVKESIVSIKNNDELIAQAICDYEKGIAKIILLCVDNLEFGLGINKLVQILKGNQTKFITDFSLQNNIAFSLLKQFSKKDIEYIINILAQTEYLDKQAYNNGFGDIYKVGIKGYAFLKNDMPLEISFIDAIAECDFIELDSNEMKLYENLRALRYQIAKENDCPSYTVCGDLALRKMAEILPNNYEQMLEIKGIGPSFIEKYADCFISVIKQFESTKE